MYGQRNYLGNMDQELLRQISEYVPESPYASVARRDPTFGPAAADFMYNLAHPPMNDIATGVPQPIVSSREDEGPSAFDIITGVMTAPVRALGLVKQSVEDAIGHSNSYRRAAGDAAIETATKLGILSNTLSRDQKMAIFPDRAAEIDAMYAARSGQGGDTAMGRDTSMLPTPEPRKTGFLEWLTGQNRRIRAQQLAQVAMVEHALGQSLKEAQIRTKTEQGNLYGTKAEHERFLTDVDYRYLDRDRLLGQDKVRSEIGENNASTFSSMQSGYSSAATRDRTRQAMGFDANAEERAQAAERRDRIADMLARSGKRLEIAGKRYDNRGKVLDLRTKELGDAGTVYNNQGLPFKLNEYLDNRNKEGADTAEVDRAYDVPTRTVDPWYAPAREEPDYEAMRTPPSRRAGATDAAPATEAPPQKSIAPPDPMRVEQISTLLRRALPVNTTRDADVQARAQEIDRMNLDYSTPEAFYDSASANGLSDQEIAILWNGRNGTQK